MQGQTQATRRTPLSVGPRGAQAIQDESVDGPCRSTQSTTVRASLSSRQTVSCMPSLLKAQ